MTRPQDFFDQPNQKRDAEPSGFVIPAIDIVAGKCVRLTQGDYAQMKVYNEDPLEVAKQFEAAGLRRLHLVDLDGARVGAVQNWKVLELLAARTRLIVDFGGGVKKMQDAQIVFNSGAHYCTIGSIAVHDGPEFGSWLMHFGPDRFLLGADVKDQKIAIDGWQVVTDLLIYDFIRKYQALGVRQVFCTDVSKDGLLGGPATGLYREIISQFPDLFFIGSGGVSSMQDLYELKALGCKAVIVGKAIYEGRVRLSELSQM
jgi:phosphoribosylformimino-5-aminoimidazole carboxamide ribotide isomerase